jgi:hypothetical protein
MIGFVTIAVSANRSFIGTTPSFDRTIRCSFAMPGTDCAADFFVACRANATPVNVTHLRRISSFEHDPHSHGWQVKHL